MAETGVVMPVYSSFAGILEYPDASLARSVGDCAAALAQEAPESHAHLIEFQNEIADKSPGQLQEMYTNAFDLRPDCTPNLGYHLFGDDSRRGLFLAELKARMQALNIHPGAELPDHISLVLRYVDMAEEEERLCVIEDCVLPAVSRMVTVIEHSENPYGRVLRALLCLIRRQHEEFMLSGEAAEPVITREPFVVFNILE